MDENTKKIISKAGCIRQRMFNMTRFKEAKQECLTIRKTVKRAIRTPFCLCARLLPFVSIQVSGEHTAV